MKTIFSALALFLAGSTNALAGGGLLPEPGTLALVGLAVVGIVAVSRKRK